MARYPLLIAALLIAAGCVKHQPPVQMMAEARAALQAAHRLHPPAESAAAGMVKKADAALHQASLLLAGHRFDEARAKARVARNLARRAIRMQQRRATRMQQQ
ncbi:MAG: DUF4398 domain-containing protein [Zetaproteobacteria bacterium]|nr:MAG: DUF4398 domain-containing protein [Zetaproteobacteria bacterium]